MGLDFFHEKIVRNGRNKRFQPKDVSKKKLKTKKLKRKNKQLTRSLDYRNLKKKENR